MTPPKCENCGNDMEPGYLKEWTCYHCFCYIDHKKDCENMTEYPCIFCVYNDETCSMCWECDNYSCFVDKDSSAGFLVYQKEADLRDYPCRFCANENTGRCLRCDGFSCFIDKIKQDPLMGFFDDLTCECKRERLPGGPLPAKDKLFHEERPAATPEPMSKAGVDYVLPELIKDLEARTAVGVKSYGKPLQTHIGRDPLMDAYQECLDQAQYLKQEIMEREKPFSECIAEWANARKLYDTATPYSQMKKLFEELFEWFDEVKSGDQEAEQVELGDCLVVLQNIANMRNYDLVSCGWLAYHKIKNRSGKTIGGTFVKE